MLRSLTIGLSALALAACGNSDETPPATDAATPAAQTSDASTDAPVTADQFKIDGAWVRMPLNGRDVTAAYFTLTSKTDAEAKLIAISTSASETAELHTHIFDKEASTMTMQRVDSFDLPAELKPMGNHIMMFGVPPELAEGDTVTLELTILSGDESVTVTTEAPVSTFQ